MGKNLALAGYLSCRHQQYCKDCQEEKNMMRGKHDQDEKNEENGRMGELASVLC